MNSNTLNIKWPCLIFKKTFFFKHILNITEVLVHSWLYIIYAKWFMRDFQTMWFQQNHGSSSNVCSLGFEVISLNTL